MNVAVLDDQKECLAEISKYLKQINLISKVREFNKINQLQLALECNEQFDIILMDIDLGLENTNKTGIDIASEISILYPHIQIIYITGYNEKFVQQIFLKFSNLCGYVLKPIDPNILNKNILNAWNRIENNKGQRLTITYKSRAYTVLSKTITYIESRGHKATIHTNTEEITCYESLKQLKKRLNKSFLFCHQSFLVNIKEISRIEKNKVIFLNGEEVPISKMKYDSFRKQYFDFLENFD